MLSVPLSSGSFGERPVINRLRFNVDLFLRSKCTHGDPFFDDGVRHSQVRVKLVAVNRVESFSGGPIEFEQLFKKSDADFPLALEKQDRRALAAQHPDDLI